MDVCNAEPYELVDPARGEPFASCTMSSPEDVTTAVTRTARAAGQWATIDWGRRESVLRQTAKAVRGDADRIAATLTQEQGKPLKEARIEVMRCADTFDFFADEQFAPTVRPRALDGKQAWTATLPLGVVAAIAPWNFPLTLLANKLVPALAAGNGVVVKPAPTTPLATRAVLRHLASAGLPEGVVTTVLGGADVGRALVGQPEVAMVSFTGSTPTGRVIMAAAADRVKRLALELGGSDALVVDADADVAGAAKAAAVGRFFNCGQACVAVKRVFVHDDVADDFLDALVARIDRLVVGDGRDPGVLIGPQHTRQQREHTLELIRDAKNTGGRVLRGGGVPDDPALEAGFFVSPTLVADVDDNARLMRDESFGPVLPVRRVATFQEAIDRANDTEFGLGSSVWSNDPEHVRQAVRDMQAGYTWINDMSIDYDTLPFGGLKQSGFGKERGREAIEEFRAVKSVVSTTNWAL